MRNLVVRIALVSLSAVLPAACLHSQTAPPQTASKIQFSAPHMTSLGSGLAAPLVLVSSGDVNGDGKTDIMLRDGNGNPLLYLGDGKGGFTPQASGAFSSTDQISVLADVNGDGYADYISTTNGICSGRYCEDGTPGSLNVYLSDGKGNFNGGPVASISPNVGVALVVADFNNDGKLDIAVESNQEAFFTPVVVDIFLGDGMGNFNLSQETAYFQGPGTGVSNDLALVTGDFNGDGMPDLAFSTHYQASSTIQILTGGGNGTVYTGPAYAADTGLTGPNGLVAANLNGDGKTDLAAALMPRYVPGANPRVATLLGKQDDSGLYWASAVSTAFDAGIDPPADLTGNGKPDLVMTDGDHASIEVLANQGGGVFSPLHFAASNGVYSSLAVPLSTGTLPDILFTTNGSGNLGILTNESK